MRHGQHQAKGRIANTMQSYTFTSVNWAWLGTRNGEFLGTLKADLAKLTFACFNHNHYTNLS